MTNHAADSDYFFVGSGGERIWVVEQKTSAPGCKKHLKKLFLLWGLVLPFIGSQQAHCDSSSGLN